MKLLAKTIASLLLGLSLFGACKSTETAPSDQVSVALNKSARVGVDLTVRVDTLNDSRCPLGAVCIWEGIAVVSAVVSNSKEQQRVRLHLNSRTRETRLDSAAVTLSGLKYKVILRAVTPYPDITKSQPERQAIIHVAKL